MSSQPDLGQPGEWEPTDRGPAWSGASDSAAEPPHVASLEHEADPGAVPGVLLGPALIGRPATWRGRLVVAPSSEVDVTIVRLVPEPAVREEALASLEALPGASRECAHLPDVLGTHLVRAGIAVVAVAVDGSPASRWQDLDPGAVVTLGLPLAQTLVALHARGWGFGSDLATEAVVDAEGRPWLPLHGLIRRRTAGSGALARPEDDVHALTGLLRAALGQATGRDGSRLRALLQEHDGDAGSEVSAQDLARELRRHRAHPLPALPLPSPATAPPPLMQPAAQARRSEAKFSAAAEPPAITAPPEREPLSLAELLGFELGDDWEQAEQAPAPTDASRPAVDRLAALRPDRPGPAAQRPAAPRPGPPRPGALRPATPHRNAPRPAPRRSGGRVAAFPIAAAAGVVAAALGWLFLLGPAHHNPASTQTLAQASAPATTATTQAAAATAPTTWSAARWTEVLELVDAQRAAALSGSTSLESAEVPGSPAYRRDAAVVADLRAGGLRPQGGPTPSLRGVAVVSASPTAVVLRVTDVLPAYELLNASGAVISREPGRGVARWTVTLTAPTVGGGSWRLANVVAT